MGQKKQEFYMNLRIVLVPLLFIILGFSIVIYRLAILQLVDPDNYAEYAKSQQMAISPIIPNRGTIYDRNKNILANSASAWKVVLAPNAIPDTMKNELVVELSEILDIDFMTLSQKVHDNSNGYAVIARRVEEPLKKKVEEYREAIKDKEGKIIRSRIPGISFEPDAKRYYHYGTLASTVLGFTGDEHHGSNGIELYYDEVLSGINGRNVRVTNERGRAIPFAYDVSKYEAQDGYSLVLTIDERIQKAVEKHLNLAIEKYSVKNRAVGIVMNVNTGEVLAMAVEQGFDPNNPQEISNKDIYNQIQQLPDTEKAQAYSDALYTQWRNKAVSDRYEPGSVYKILTGAAALESGTTVLGVNDNFYCKGSRNKEVIAGEEVGCWNPTPHGMQTFEEGMMHSCNPAFMEMGRRLGVTGFFKYFKAFGFTEKTGIDLPAEAVGHYHTDQDMKEIHLVTASFGQTFTTTPIQMATAVAAAVNGGYLVTPHVMKYVVDNEDNIIESNDEHIRRQVISEEVSRDITDSLYAVVNKKGGSGKNAYVEGYRIGGKTGTAQKTETRDKETARSKETWSSFAAVAPTDDPQVIVLVVLDTPFDDRHASTLSAPVAGDISRDILQYAGVEPHYTEAEKLNQLVAIPSVIGMDTEMAKESLAQAGLQVSVQGENGKIVKQVPLHGFELGRDGTVVIYTDKADLEKEKLALVPDLVPVDAEGKARGVSPKQAVRMLNEAGLNVVLKGGAADEVGAVVISQSEIAGSKVPIGTIVELVCIVEDEIQ